MNYYIPNSHDKKEVVFNQAAGLGDVLFIEPIYRHYHEQGYNVIAPVNDDLIWIAEYIPYVEFHKRSQFKYSYETVEQKNDGRLHLPTRFSHPLLRGYELHYGDERQNWMPDKYEFLGLPVDLWRTLKFERNKEREELLYNAVAEAFTNGYNFINNNFGGSFEKINIKPDNDLPCVYMSKIEGFTMLDWGKVIENAQKIYTAETSLIYFVESLKFTGEKHLFPRYPFMDNCEYMRLTLGDGWIYHDKTDLI